MGGCSLRDAIENDGKAKTKIKPFASSEKLIDRYGDTITIKIPLGKNNIGYFDKEGDVLGYEAEKLNNEGRSFVGQLWDNLKLTGARFAVGVGLFNKFKISSHFDFEYLNQDFLKSARIKRVFFTTEVCRDTEINCNNEENKTTNFTFVDELMVNVEGYEDIAGEKPKVDLPTEAKELKPKEFKRFIKLAENQSKIDVEKKILALNNKDKNLGELELDQIENKSINLVRFESVVPQMKLDISALDEDERHLTLHVKNKERRGLIKDYFKKLKGHVKRVSTNRDGVNLTLRKGITPKLLLEKVGSDQSPVAANMIIFRLNTQQAEAKNFFNSEKFEGVVREASVVGESVYVELLSSGLKDQFLGMINADNNFVGTDLDVYTVDTCTQANCIEVKALDFNLLDLLAANPKIKLDTILSVKSLSKQDFQYNGFIEIEIVIDDIGI